MNNIRLQFPIFQRDPDLVYLDSAASAQKPRLVIDAMREVMEQQYANVHRGLYPLSENLTQRYEEARNKVRQFVGARSVKEIIFTKNATEAINLVAYAWALENVHNDDVILITEMEHHSNYLPWLMVAEKVGAKVESIPFDKDTYQLQLSKYKELVEEYGERIKLVAVTHVSNVLGTINPIKEIVRTVRGTGAKIVVDGCQAVAHLPVNVQDLDVDFYAFSGHKVYGPTGVGVLYAKRDVLEYMHPFLYGGEMVMQVADQEAGERNIWKELPWKFEAGTPPIVEAISLGVAIDWFIEIGFDAVRKHEQELMKIMIDEFARLENVTLYGSKDISERVGAFSFTMSGIHAHDVAQFLGQKSICVRAGHHCTQPLHRDFGLNATVRASLGIYSTSDDVMRFITALKDSYNLFV